MAEVESYSTKLTTRGAADIVRAIFEGTKINLVSAEFGDGGGESYEPTTDQTDLKNLCYTGSVESLAINDENDNMLDIITSIPTEIGGFTAREVGIRDEDGDLFCVGCIPAAEVVVGTSLVSNELTVVLHIVVADASVVSFTLSDSIRYLTQSDMETHENDENTHKNLWIPGSFYAVCDTEADETEKEAGCDQILNQQPGTIVRCTFTEASADGSQTLNVAGLGAYPLVDLDGNAASWDAEDELIIQFDGNKWVVLLNLTEEQRTAKRPLYYGVCKTSASTQNKLVNIDGFVLTDGIRAAVQLKYGNTATSAKLNISSTGAYSICHNGENIPANFFTTGAWILVEYCEEEGVYNVLGDYSQATSTVLGRVRVLDEADESKTAAGGYAVSPAALTGYIAASQVGQAGGVAALDEDGKVSSDQLQGGWVLSNSEPTDTTLLWISTSGVLKYYDGSSWVNVLPVWG